MTSEKGKRILARIRKVKPFVQASLSIRQIKCGKPTCRCAKEGPIHEAGLLTWKEKGRTRTLHVPAELRQEVETWIQEGRLLKSLMREMSQAQREVLLAKRKSR
jgi:hypothetical protein